MRTYQAFFRINYAIKMGRANLTYEIQTRPGPQGDRLLEFTVCPVIFDEEKPLTLNELLAAFDLTPAAHDLDLPDFVADAFSKISLTSFRLG